MIGSRARALAWLVTLCATTSGCEGNGPTVIDDDWEVWAVQLPAPTFDPPAPAGSSVQTIVLAGGCFWGVEAVFRHVKGVTAVTSGYSGGTAATANYNAVTSGSTDHAESVQIRFDPAQISFGKLLQVFFSVAHDPTQIDAQFPDSGPEYRSHIYYVSELQRDVARAYIAQLDASGKLPSPIATRLDPLVAFYRAEENHQDYAARNPTDDQVVRFELPKVEGLRSIFPDLYQAL